MSEVYNVFLAIDISKAVRYGLVYEDFLRFGVLLELGILFQLISTQGHVITPSAKAIEAHSEKKREISTFSISPSIPVPVFLPPLLLVTFQTLSFFLSRSFNFSLSLSAASQYGAGFAFIPCCFFHCCHNSFPTLFPARRSQFGILGSCFMIDVGEAVNSGKPKQLESLGLW